VGKARTPVWAFSFCGIPVSRLKIHARASIPILTTTTSGSGIVSPEQIEILAGTNNYY